MEDFKAQECRLHEFQNESCSGLTEFKYQTFMGIQPNYRMIMLGTLTAGSVAFPILAGRPGLVLRSAVFTLFGFGFFVCPEIYNKMIC